MISFLSCTWGKLQVELSLQNAMDASTGEHRCLEIDGTILVVFLPALRETLQFHCMVLMSEGSVQWAETSSVLFSEHGPGFLAHEEQSHCNMSAYQKPGVSCKQTTMVEGWEGSPEVIRPLYQICHCKSTPSLLLAVSKDKIRSHPATFTRSCGFHEGRCTKSRRFCRFYNWKASRYWRWEVWGIKIAEKD